MPTVRVELSDKANEKLVNLQLEKANELGEKLNKAKMINYLLENISEEMMLSKNTASTHTTDKTDFNERLIKIEKAITDKNELKERLNMVEKSLTTLQKTLKTISKG